MMIKIFLVNAILFFAYGVTWAQSDYSEQKYIILKAQAKHDDLPGGADRPYDIHGGSFKVLEVLKGKVDSLTYDSTVSVGYYLPKGDPYPKFIKDSIYLLFLKDSVIEYTPVSKIIGDPDTIEDPWIAPKKYAGTIPYYYPVDSGPWIYTWIEKAYSVEGTHAKQISVNKEFKNYDLMIVNFDALRLKDRIEVLEEISAIPLFDSKTFIAGKLTFPIFLREIKNDNIILKVSSEEKKSNWKITYRFLKLLPVPLKVFNEEE